MAWDSDTKRSDGLYVHDEMVRAGPAGALMLLCDFAGAPNGAELHCEIAEMAPTPDETRASFKAAERA